MINFKIGILGTGNIADKIADTIAKLDAFEVYAVASRDAQKAADFAAKYDIKKSYGSYEELVQDSEIELVYVATPHQCHAENAIMCINAGKPVLVEKPFSYNNKTTQDVIALAREKKVFCGEAMWSCYAPLLKLTKKLIETRKIGDVRYINASLCYNLIEKERLVKPEYAGGALLDIGVYPLVMVFALMGQMPVAASSSCVRLSTGVDAVDTVQLNFQGGKAATVFTSMMYDSENMCIIYGTEGRIEIDNVNYPTEVRIYDRKNQLTERATVSDMEITGYEHQFLAAREAIITGKLDTPDRPHKDIVNTMGFCDMLRRSWQIFYPLPGEESLKVNPNQNPTNGKPDGPVPGIKRV